MHEIRLYKDASQLVVDGTTYDLTPAQLQAIEQLIEVALPIILALLAGS